METRKTIFIVGATGKQGRATINALLQHKAYDPSVWHIQAMSRNPTSAAAKRLEELSPSIKVIKGDLQDASTAFKNLASKPWAVFVMTSLPSKPKPETQVGKSFIDEAIKAGAKHIVFTSVDRGSANNGFNRTLVPHFQTKHDIEAYLIDAVKEKDITYTILRPTFFLDNLEWGFGGKVMATVWRDKVDRKLQVIDSADIGSIAANALLEFQSPVYKNKAISLASDELTFGEADSIFQQKTGRNIPSTVGIAGTLLTSLVRDIRLMIQFFNEPGFGADIAFVKGLAPVASFAEWAGKVEAAKK